MRAINHCHEMYEKLNQTIVGISNLKNHNLSRVIQENSRYVFGELR
ncbi:hypothetical protein KGF46_16380 [Clostridioides sp. ZZV14-6153]|nr:hypothetical protein [Clostridioides sp. ZZV14-6153]